MIRHVVTFRFREDTSRSDIDELISELEAFPQRYPAMQRFCLGLNRSTRDDTFSHAFSIEFDTEDELVEYLASDYHLWFVAERWRPLIAERAIVTWEC